MTEVFLGIDLGNPLAHRSLTRVRNTDSRSKDRLQFCSPHLIPPVSRWFRVRWLDRLNAAQAGFRKPVRRGFLTSRGCPCIESTGPTAALWKMNLDFRIILSHPLDKKFKNLGLKLCKNNFLSRLRLAQLTVKLQQGVPNISASDECSQYPNRECYRR